MKETLLKILVLLLIFAGEGLAIYAEMIGARDNNIATQSFLNIFLKMFLVIAVAGAFLIAGYMLGFNSFKNIWIVSVISITSILIIEPILAWTIFGQTPTPGAIIGFSLGTIGLFISIFF